MSSEATREAPPSEAPPSTAPARRPRPPSGLSATQVVAAALAAITATVAASFLGVAGTVVGAAVASVVATVGNAVYTHSLRRTHARVRDAVPLDQVFLRGGRAVAPAATTAQENVIHRPPGRIRWTHVATGAAALFAVVLALVTGVELMAGRPVSDLVRGDAGVGTSLFGTTATTGRSTAPETPTVTRTVTPSVVVVPPTVTRTAPPATVTTTPTSPTPTSPTPAPPSTAPSGTDAAPSGTGTQLG